MHRKPEVVEEYPRFATNSPVQGKREINLDLIMSGEIRFTIYFHITRDGACFHPLTLKLQVVLWGRIMD